MKNIRKDLNATIEEGEVLLEKFLSFNINGRQVSFWMKLDIVEDGDVPNRYFVQYYKPEIRISYADGKYFYYQQVRLLSVLKNTTYSELLNLVNVNGEDFWFSVHGY